MARIHYSDRVRSRDIPNLDPSIRSLVGDAISSKLTTAPAAFGKPLRHTLRSFRVLRVGDWRVIYILIEDDVLIVAIRHRREGYDDLS